MFRASECVAAEQPARQHVSDAKEAQRPSPEERVDVSQQWSPKTALGDDVNRSTWIAADFDKGTLSDDMTTSTAER
jgi:hypothetical protein